jgi:hypothetical protein
MMSATKNNLAALCDDVLAKSAEFAQRLRGSLPSVLVEVGHYSNDAFLLRSFVSLRGDNQGAELAMTVNITRPPSNQAKQIISIESDLCLDDGTIVAAGPGATLDPSNSGFEQDLSVWTAEFAVFLDASEADAIDALREIVLKPSTVKAS